MSENLLNKSDHERPMYFKTYLSGRLKLTAHANGLGIMPIKVNGSFQIHVVRTFGCFKVVGTWHTSNVGVMWALFLILIEHLYLIGVWLVDTIRRTCFVNFVISRLGQPKSACGCQGVMWC